MKKLEFLILAAIIILAFGLRLYKISRPIGDWHSWRQADTAAVARNFIKEGFNPFIPTFDDMSTQTNGLDNPNRYRFVEFPIYNAIIAGVWKITGISVTYARLVTVVSTLFSVLLLYFIVRYFSGRKVALFAAFFFATIPYNVFYSSTILPGPFMVTFVLATYWFFIKWLDKHSNLILLALATLCANIAILSWPIALFFMVPLVYLAFDKFGFAMLKNVKIWIFGILSVAPFIAWRAWMLNFPAGIPNWQFVINNGNIRFKGAYFRWIFEDRMGRLILTVGGVPLFILGLLRKIRQEKLFYFSLLFGCGLYLVIFASGNVQHDYYQVPLIPTLSIFMALGADFLFFEKNFFNKYVGVVSGIVLLAFLYAFGFYEVRGYYWINRPQIVEAGQAADKLLPKNATVIAPYNGDTAFLYQTNRHGYPIVDRPLEKFVESNTHYLISVDPQDSGIKNLSRKCQTLESTADYVIINLSLSCLSSK